MDVSSTASISALTITGGDSNTNGGGIVNAGALTTSGMVVSNSTASQNGGGIYNTGNIAFNTSTISGNTAAVNGGGVASSGTFTLYDSTISGNTGRRRWRGHGIIVARLYLTQDTLAGQHGPLTGPLLRMRLPGR